MDFLENHFGEEVDSHAERFSLVEDEADEVEVDTWSMTCESAGMDINLMGSVRGVSLCPRRHRAGTTTFVTIRNVKAVLPDGKKEMFATVVRAASCPRWCGELAQQV